MRLVFRFSLPSNFLDGTNLSLPSYFANTKSQATGLELWQKIFTV